MQIKKQTTTIVMITTLTSLLLLLFTITTGAMLPKMVFAQDSEGGSEEKDNENGTVVGSIFAEGNNNTETPNRAEIIDEDGNVLNPGGQNPQDAVVTDEQEDDSRPTNLQNLVPKSIQQQELADFETALRMQGYSISDTTSYPEYGTGTPIVIVRGIQGVTSDKQPDDMTLAETGQQYGYALSGNTYIDNGQLTLYRGVFGSATTATTGGGHY